ncbi:TonB-dependent receptor [Zavarzinia compransoris]|uniref:TonB-dependent receptor n=1 Tax=Zavarzinia marina TaxID=2911065 RepID=UPI001F236E8D|nr:TonB-dependent receptor [Zavarzinia marina]MCF4166585.1 TonB-dependent receptor [Zavarzinia marina]
MYSRFFLSLVAASVAPCAIALAQQGSGETVILDMVTVTATRADRSLAEVPQTLQVIDRATIERQLRQANSAGALLSKFVPGYSVGNQTVSSASETFRGRNLLVMIDGVPLNTPLRDVSRILSLIDLNTVERVELVAGASSTWGSGATGGTVNFITRAAGEDSIGVDVSTRLRAFTRDFGNSLAPEVSATVHGRSDSIDYSATATGRFADRTYDGWGRELASDAMLGQGGGDRYAEGNLSARLGHDFDAARRLELSGSYFYLDQDPDALTDYSGAFAAPDFATPYPGESLREDTKSFSARFTDDDFVLGGLNVTGFYNDVEKRFSFSTLSIPANSIVYFSGDVTDPTSPSNQSVLFSERLGVNVTIDSDLDSLLPGLSLTWGTDVTHDETWQELVSGEDLFTPLDQMSYAGFADLQFQVLDGLTLRGGLRYEYLELSVDDYIRPAAYYGFSTAPLFGYVLPALPVTGGDFDYDALTFNLGAVYAFDAGTEVYAGFNQGFGLPDVGAFTRRAGVGFAFACPAPNTNCALPPGTSVSYAAIGPEAQIVDNYEIGIRSAGADYRLSLAGFLSRSDEGVNFDPATNTISQQKEEIIGIEATAEVDVTESLTLGAVAAWREGRFDSDGDGKLDRELPNNRIATPFHGTLWGEYRFEAGTGLRLETEFMTGRHAFDGTVDHETESTMLLNVAVDQPLLGGDLSLSVNNVFDTAYDNPTATATRNLAVPAWGRTVTLGYARSF